jgi:hypothetical protein
MISQALKERFESVIEIRNIDWAIVEEVAISDANILRPIKGVAFEQYFRKLISSNFPNVKIKDGVGDSDIDLVVDGRRLQLKTPGKGSTKNGIQVGVALHKTHGDETRPNNLYKATVPTFDYLVVLHPVSGMMIIPYNEIPINKSWNGYLADPAIFPWDSEWLNHWELLGIKKMKGISLDKREVPANSMLPILSKETYLEDFEIVEMLCKPEYFRAAVMGLKGNIKEHWFKNKMKQLGFTVLEPDVAYAKYDLRMLNNLNVEKRIQVKGTSKNMCSIVTRTCGFEIMSTHGQFPNRGYRRSSLDYVAVVISEDQMPADFPSEPGLNFLMLNIHDFPTHFLVGKGLHGQEKDFGNEKWNHPEYVDIIYPIIKLKYDLVEGQVEFQPNIESYTKSRGHIVIPIDSPFRQAGPYILNRIPDEFLP